jgi:hypothetical protein
MTSLHCALSLQRAKIGNVLQRAQEDLCWDRRADDRRSIRLLNKRHKNAWVTLKQHTNTYKACMTGPYPDLPPLAWIRPIKLTTRHGLVHEARHNHIFTRTTLFSGRIKSVVTVLRKDCLDDSILATGKHVATVMLVIAASVVAMHVCG